MYRRLGFVLITGVFLAFTVAVQATHERGAIADVHVEQMIAPGSHGVTASLDAPLDFPADCLESIVNVGDRSLVAGGLTSTELLWDSGEEELHFARPARCKKVARVTVYCRACTVRSGVCSVWKICRSYWRYECDPNRL